MASKLDNSLDTAGVHGVEVDIVCKNVPVVTMDKSSEFEENASWMLQTACDSGSKADALYEYTDDPDIMAACRSLGLGKDEVNIVRLKNMKNVRAVGASGKRSTMLACVVAMSLNDPDGLDDLWEGLRMYKIHRQYWDILEMIKAATGGGPPSAREEPDTKGPKRKWDDDSSRKYKSANESVGKGDSSWRHESSGGRGDKSDDKWGYSGGDDWGSSKYSKHSSSGVGSGKKQWASTASALDDQLESYFKD